MIDPKPTLIQRFNALPSGSRNGIVGGVCVLLILAFGTVFLDGDSSAKNAKPPVQKEGVLVLNPGNSNATEAIAVNLTEANKRIQDQADKIALLNETAKQAQAQSKEQSGDGHWSEISNLTAQVQALQERMNSTGAASAKTDKTADVDPKSKGLLDRLLPQASDSANNAPSAKNSNGIGVGSLDNSQTGSPLSTPVALIQVVGEEKKASKVASKKEAPPAYIPSGSNFEAVLLNGMDASTAIGANRSPTPALLRIKSDAILPNLFSFNVRECFVMVGGFGNMSTERVEMRTETMSCIAENGEVYEGKIEGYLVGEDGKAGARGRVVSKQGALLAKSFMAGFVGGIGSAFSPQPVPALSLAGGTGGAPAYQYPTADQVVGNGISTGLNKSSQSLANFYIKLAEQMFPIVELDAGRKLTIILLKGVDLKMEKKV